MQSASVSLLVKGSLTTKFQPTRGLRQGEGLVGIVRHALKGNLLKGVKVGRDEVESFMLQFVDDTLFLCEASFSNVFTMKDILRCYELAHGLKMNFHISNLTGINVERIALDFFAKSLN